MQCKILTTHCTQSVSLCDSEYSIHHISLLFSKSSVKEQQVILFRSSMKLEERTNISEMGIEKKIGRCKWGPTQ